MIDPATVAGASAAAQATAAVAVRSARPGAGEPGRTRVPDGSPSYRILVVDDNPSIHDDFRRIFADSRPAHDDLDDLAASVFGLAGEPVRPSFALDHALQGQAAVARVEAAHRADEAYALLFMDVRMPPGWDGIEAAARVLELDPDVHVVLCTAYPEQGWRQRVEALPGRERVLVLKKPFDVVEVQQLASALCERWSHGQRDRARLHDLERSVSEQRDELAATTIHLRQEIEGRTRAEQQLRKAERLEGLGRLAAGLCHEINNPLSYIVASAELMHEELQDIEQQIPAVSHQELSQLLHAVTLGASRITRLVRNIRMFARKSEAPPELVHLVDAVDTALGMVQRQLAPQVVIDVDTRRTAPALARRFELEQVLINLVENALHALVEQHDPPPRVLVRARSVGVQSVVLEVIDNGPGIDEAILDSIFDPFFTTKPVNKGTGLGLSICHTLVEDMGGTIDARNGPQRGAVFTVTLPAAAHRRSPRLTPMPDDAEPAASRCGRVLVIDDEPLVLSMLVRTLRPHAVTCCSNATDGLAQCLREPFDVILCDVMMPGLNGWELHHRLAAARPGMEARVAFITGGALLDDVRELLARVPNRTFEKPFDARELRAYVNERVDELAPTE